MKSHSSSERIVGMPVVNPDGGSSRTFTYRGRVDRIEGTCLIDWKTVADTARFINEKAIGYQDELYTLALYDEGIEIDQVEYRLIQRPGIRFCNKDKTLDDYVNRCIDWLMTTENAVMTHHVFINPDRIKQARYWLWNISKRILDNRRNDRWLTNEQSCYTWQRECPYLPLCLALSSGGDVQWLIDNNYEPRPQHEELEEIEPEDKETITYSSGKMLTLCEQRYYWQYELAIRKKQEETGEALYIGSIVHHGLDVFSHGGLEAAMTAIDKWATDHPVIGEDAFAKQQTAIGKAKAIVRVAMEEKWGEQS